MADQNFKKDNIEEEFVETDDIILEEEVEAESSFKKNKDSKLQKLEAELEKCRAEKQEYLDGWQRSKADFINAKKRYEEDKQNLLKYAETNLISELIPTLDAFDMAMANKEVWEKADQKWRTGIEYIYSQLIGTLQSHGLEKMNPLNQIFDPNNHHSVAVTDTDNKENDNRITEVISWGYSLNGKIIREAQVKVAQFKENPDSIIN
jgi:molecular chaperone GrpE